MIKKRYLAILPCSKEKKRLNNVQAIDLYNGPFYKMMRKYYLENVDILIISAKYGLINSGYLISHYDQKITKQRAKEIAQETKSRLNDVLKNNKYDEILINLGKTYMLALDESESVLEGQNVCWINGKIGERLHQLKIWLDKIENGGENHL